MKHTSSNTMSYKGYVGSVEFSEPDGVFHGKVLGVKSLISYEGQTVRELVDDFHETIDFYLETCEAEGIKPERPFKGSFNVRIDPKIHSEAAIYARNHGISLNSFVEKAISEKLQRC